MAAVQVHLRSLEDSSPFSRKYLSAKSSALLFIKWFALGIDVRTAGTQEYKYKKDFVFKKVHGTSGCHFKIKLIE